MSRGGGTWGGLGAMRGSNVGSVTLSLRSLRQEQWMNVRVGDIIKLENNQFVAVSLAPR